MDMLIFYDCVVYYCIIFLSIIEVVSKNSDWLISNFSDYFKQVIVNFMGLYKIYIILVNNEQDQMELFIIFLDCNGIEYGCVGNLSIVNVFNYQMGKNESLKIGNCDLVISVYQLCLVFIQVLFDLVIEVVDFLIYDIIVWSFLYVYGLDVYVISICVNVVDGYDFGLYKNELGVNSSFYVYLVFWNLFKDVYFLVQFFKVGIQVWVVFIGF